MKFIIVRSGSKGNATLVIDQGCVLLIDMGICLKTLKEELKEIGMNIYNIDALLLTHSHSDHTSGVKYLKPLPIYCTKDTYDAEEVNLIYPFESFEIKGIKITPLPTSHDAENSVGFLFEKNNKKLVYMTDTGMIDDASLEKMKNADYYIIESNHNVKKLLKTNRPVLLKQRILSDKGHLSNEDSAIYMSKLVGDKTKEIVLAHLSQEANEPELALKAYKKIFEKCKICLDKIKINCANQNYSISGGSL